MCLAKYHLQFVYIKACDDIVYTSFYIQNWALGLCVPGYLMFSVSPRRVIVTLTTHYVHNM